VSIKILLDLQLISRLIQTPKDIGSIIIDEHSGFIQRELQSIKEEYIDKYSVWNILVKETPIQQIVLSYAPFKTLKSKALKKECVILYPSPSGGHYSIPFFTQNDITFLSQINNQLHQNIPIQITDTSLLTNENYSIVTRLFIGALLIRNATDSTLGSVIPALIDFVADARVNPSDNSEILARVVLLTKLEKEVIDKTSKIVN